MNKQNSLYYLAVTQALGQRTKGQVILLYMEDWNAGKMEYWRALVQ